jgi:hypothetical protein
LITFCTAQTTCFNDIMPSADRQCAIVYLPCSREDQRITSTQIVSRCLGANTNNGASDVVNERNSRTRSNAGAENAGVLNKRWLVMMLQLISGSREEIQANSMRTTDLKFLKENMHWIDSFANTRSLPLHTWHFDIFCHETALFKSIVWTHCGQLRASKREPVDCLTLQETCVCRPTANEFVLVFLYRLHSLASSHFVYTGYRSLNCHLLLYRHAYFHHITHDTFDRDSIFCHGSSHRHDTNRFPLCIRKL